MLNKYADKHYSKEALLLKRKRAQEEIFTAFDWWDKSCFLYQMTGDRCDYIESCITRVFGKGALAQQEILEIGSGGGLPPGIHNYQSFIKPIELQALITINGLQVQETTGFIPRGFTNGHFKMGPGPIKSVAYVGYATKGR